MFLFFSMALCLSPNLPLIQRLSPLSPFLVLWLAGWLVLQPGVGRASNLDTRFPMLKEGGSRGSLFGFSVALHEQRAGGGRRYLLLVGAPKEKAEPDVSANQTGGVYSCPITTDQSDCTRMNFIGSDINLDHTEDLVEDMWLGVSVASQRQPGGRVLACGHRFMKMFGVLKLRHMIGKCYLRGNDLQYDPNDMHWQNPDQVCSHLADSGEFMCNMGISAAISQNELIVGSPGSYEWQGNVHVSWMNPEVQFDTQRSSFPNMDRRHIYMGYSVAQASGLLSQDVVTIVTGAPKDSKEDGRGSVILAERTGPVSGGLLTPRLTLRGEQMGSYYGNTLAITDLNNDGWADLLVGAPFYFHRQREEGGSVYVYLNQNGQVGPEASTTLRGPHASGFGMALVAIGDLNQDGFQDFAVGAPFHGTGSVMIWTGSAEGISKDPSQVIQGSDISAGFMTFGYSLDGGLDVDQNRYPDLLVGSLDDRVALLRARPVIQLNKTLRVTPEIVDPNNCNYCVQVEVCFSYILSTGDKNFRKNITVQFSVEADVTRHSSRLRFHDNGQDVFHGFLSMPSQRCRTLRLGLLKPIRDKVEPLTFSLNVSLYENPPRNHNSLQSLDQYPVLSQARPTPTRTQIHIQKACGSDNRCQSNLQMKAEFTNEQLIPFPSEQGSQLFHYSTSVRKLLLVVDVTNFPSPGRPGEDAHNAALNITIPPSLKYSGVRSKSRSPVVECSAENQVLLCELGNPFSSNQKAQVLIIFETSEISLDTREIHSTLQLSTLSEQSDLSAVSLLMLVEYSLETSFTLIKKPSHTQFSGHVIGESAMMRTSDIGSPLDFTFKVDIVGKPLGHLGNLEVEFDWPWEVSNGKWLLYLTEIRLDGTSESHCVPPGDIINPLNLTLSEEERRRRRSMEEEKEEQTRVQSVFKLQGARKKSYTLDCVHGAARCVKFICPMVNMNNTATVTVRSRLWNSTMIEDYSEAWRVTVKGLATLKLVTDKPTIKMKAQSTEFSVDVEGEFSEQLDHGAPLWIIIVSALAGVSLLACICLLLWKCGFFRRASTRELYEAKAQKAHMKTQPSELERLTEEH